MIHPRVTWSALVTGIISVSVAEGPILEQVAHVPSTLTFLTTLFGAQIASEIQAACGLLAIVCLATAALGRSIAPSVDNPTPPAAEGK